MSDHIVDTTKMVETPITNSVKRCDQNGWVVVPVEAAYELELKLNAANARVKELEAERTKLAEECVSKSAKALIDFHRITELEEWIRGLEWHVQNVDESCDEYSVWLNPGQCAYVGPKKPKGLQ